MRLFQTAALVLVMAAAATRARGVTITMDYSNDTFFASHPVAKATLEMAAADVGSLLTTTLNPTTDSSTGTAPDGSSATFNFAANYIIDPTTVPATTQTFDPVILPQSTVKIFVGMFPLGGQTLGVGAPGGLGETGQNLVANSESGFVTAVHNLEANANINMSRDGGPTVGRLKGKFTVNTTDIPFTVNYGSQVGSLQFDNDTDNNNVIDDDATLNNYWHFDGTAPVPFAKFDFYSVAVHEILHALDFGNTSNPNSWRDNVSSTDSRDWTGSQVISLLGTADNVLQPDSKHVAEGFVSTRLSDGKAQEAVMDPSLTNGARKKVTRLDLAFLRDIGWQTIPYPLLVGDLDQNDLRTVADVQALMTALTNLNAYKMSNGFSNSDLLIVASLNADNAVTNTDAQALLCMLANDVQPAISPVPEPTAGALAAFGGVVIALSIHRIRPASRLRRTFAGHAWGDGIEGRSQTRIAGFHEDNPLYAMPLQSQSRAGTAVAWRGRHDTAAGVFAPAS
jgi:hypothetical protein